MRQGCEIHMFRSVPSDNILYQTLADNLKSSSCHLFCQPGQTLVLNKSRFETDYDLFYIPELSPKGREQYSSAQKAASFDLLTISMGVWLTRYNRSAGYSKSVSAAGDQSTGAAPTLPAELKVTKASIWFAAKPDDLLNQFASQHPDFFGQKDTPDNYSAHLYLEVAGDRASSQEDLLEKARLSTSLSKSSYTGLRIYTANRTTGLSERKGMPFCNLQFAGLQVIHTCYPST